MEKPSWIRRRLPRQEVYDEMNKVLKHFGLNTVCNSAHCPNIGKCFEKKTATFMILGNVCTRGCTYCAVTGGIPEKLDTDEPMSIALAGKEMGLKHFVITSVTRDDLPDGGAGHFADVVKAIKGENHDATVEVLIPDFGGSMKALKKVIVSGADIINHNIETTASLFETVRPEADYKESLELLKRVKEKSDILTKSGFMVGLGETDEDVITVIDDLLEAGVDIITIGQYLRPSEDHAELKRYVTPEKFDEYREYALSKGAKYVASGPFVRSSFNAEEALEIL